MIQSAVTISLVQEARGGPFVYWDDLAGSVQKAAQLGFDAVEIFAPSAEAVDAQGLSRQLDETGLKVAAVGTGAGWVIRRLCLTAESAEERQKALRFVESIIDLGAPFGAPAVIGSMQGRWGEAGEKEAVLDRLRGALTSLSSYAAERNVPLIYEPLNRYETNLCNTMSEGKALLESLGTHNVKLLADLFHMNIEEVDIAAALREGGAHIGHVHFVDSNRRAAGCGHIDYAPLAAALRDIGYDGYASAEAFAWPDSDAAAARTIETFRRVFKQ
jgi:sugar phosphate isomerase/epimerase